MVCADRPSGAVACMEGRVSGPARGQVWGSGTDHVEDVVLPHDLLELDNVWVPQFSKRLYLPQRHALIPRIVFTFHPLHSNNLRLQASARRPNCAARARNAPRSRLQRNGRYSPPPCKSKVEHGPPFPCSIHVLPNCIGFTSPASGHPSSWSWAPPQKNLANVRSALVVQGTPQRCRDVCLCLDK